MSFQCFRCLMAAAAALIVPFQSSGASIDVVISQIYGGGGNTGAPFQNDFIELHNLSGSSVDITGWSVQYASALGTSWQVTTLTGLIVPGGYYLIQEASGGAIGNFLPTPDATGVVNMSATTGKVVLSSTSVALSGFCPGVVEIVDLVGYGSLANCWEGTGRAPGLSNTLSAQRTASPDSDDNFVDFFAGSPIPRNCACPGTVPETPIPEPGTAAVVGMGAGALVLIRSAQRARRRPFRAAAKHGRVPDGSAPGMAGVQLSTAWMSGPEVRIPVQ